MRDAEVREVSFKKKRFASKLKTNYYIRKQRGHASASNLGGQTMRNVAPESKKVYVGFDVSEKTIETFAVCGKETSKGSCKIENSPAGIQKFLALFKRTDEVCVVLETGTHSLWMSRLIGSLGIEVIVAHARDLALIYGSDKKNDRLDAEKLARLAQADRKLLHPIQPETLNI